MNPNVPGFSERLIFTMGNNGKKFTPSPALGEPFVKPSITVSEDTLSAVETFIYVAGTFSRQVNTDGEVNHSIAKVCGAFGTSSTNL